MGVARNVFTGGTPTAILRAYIRSRLHSAPSVNIAGDTHLASQNNYGKRLVWAVGQTLLPRSESLVPRLDFVTANSTPARTLVNRMWKCTHLVSGPQTTIRLTRVWRMSSVFFIITRAEYATTSTSILALSAYISSVLLRH